LSHDTIHSKGYYRAWRRASAMPGDDLYEAADAALIVAAKKLADADLEALERLLDKLPLLVRLLDMLDEQTVEALEKLLGLAKELATQYGPCLEEAMKREPEKIQGLRGLLAVLKDEKAMAGLARAVELLRALGGCESGR